MTMYNWPGNWLAVVLELLGVRCSKCGCRTIVAEQEPAEKMALEFGTYLRADMNPSTVRVRRCSLCAHRL